MAKPIPNILDDLLFHTMPDDRADTIRHEDADDCTPPDWNREDADNQVNVALHPDRLPALRAYAAAQKLSLRDAVDRALALLLR